MYSDDGGDYWYPYLMIEQGGNIEYGDTKNGFIEVHSTRMFYLLETIGITWQLLFLARHLLQRAGYGATVRITLSLVGARDSILGGLSQEKGKDGFTWRETPL
jgi:hypothetical protein